MNFITWITGVIRNLPIFANLHRLASVVNRGCSCS